MIFMTLKMLRFYTNYDEIDADLNSPSFNNSNKKTFINGLSSMLVIILTNANVL